MRANPRLAVESKQRKAIITMATTESLSTLDSLFKDQYASKVQDLLPSYSYILSNVPFVGGSEEAGRALKQPVILSRVHGHTCLGTSDSTTALRSPTTAVNDVATVQACTYVSRQFVSLTSLARATGNAQSFVQATAYVVQNLTESMAHMLETQHLYGQSGLGTIASGAYADSTVGGITFTDGVNVAAKAVLISKETLAEGVWVGAENMSVDIVNTSGAKDIEAEITQVDPVLGIIWFADITGLDADPQGYTLRRAGYLGQEVPGLETILKNTGTLFGINASTKRLWRANQFDAAGALTFTTLQQAVSRAIGRGLAEELDLHVNPRIFATLIPDFNTIGSPSTNQKARMFTEESREVAVGAEKIKFFVSGHAVNLISNPMIKAGLAMGMEAGVAVRVGSTKMTFDVPGADNVYFRPLENNNSAELRMFADESIFLRKNNGSLIITGITVP